MSNSVEKWDEPETRIARRSPTSSRQEQPLRQHKKSTPAKTQLWVNPGLSDRDATTNLDSQGPATLYYLGQVVDIPEVVQVYVEYQDDGCKKYWTVLRERNYSRMEEIYDIEEDTLNRFPMTDLNFRVTIYTGEGPSISRNVIKIYDSR